MEKKSKKSIVIGITSLFLIILVLLGITYAYYRTRIIGNKNEDPSISVQTKKMEVTYEDGTSEMNMTGLIEPGFSASKTFYVKNTGDQEAKYSIIIEEMNNTYERNQDWTYVLTENGAKIAEGILAVGTHQVLSGSRSIAETNGTKNTYVLTINYANSNEDQSEDMGESLSFKVNIVDETYTWETAPQGSLLYALKTNQPTGTETTIPGQEASTENEARILSTEDDYGTSYVYRGNVVNNYVTYSNMCWRVVRVQGDGTIKLALADWEHPCGEANGYNPNDEDSAFIADENGEVKSISWDLYENAKDAFYSNWDVPNVLENWKNENLDTTKLALTDYCNDTAITTMRTDEDSGAYVWLEFSNKNTSLKCNTKGLFNTKATRYESNIAILTDDEVYYAGLATSFSAPNYLTNNATKDDNSNYIMTPGNTPCFDINNFENNIYNCGAHINMNAFYGTEFSATILGTNTYIRPVVTLNANVMLDTNVSYSQDGGMNTPYVIS